MDIGFETIIYIILGLVFVMAQVAKKKKKAMQSQQAENEDGEHYEQPKEPSVLEQLLGIPEQKPLVKKPVDNNESLQRDLDLSFSQPGPQDRIPVTVNEEVKPAMKKSEKKHSGIKNQKSGKRPDFNLRHAIIYKTVLERKNY